MTRASPINLTTRFAPSPSGLLHLGHAYAAFVAYTLAKRQGGEFLLRIEDIDQTRCKDAYTKAIFEDLHWLNFRWDGVVLHQSARMNAYAAACAKLADLGVIYGCRCTRREGMLMAPHEDDPMPPRYLGKCRHLGLVGEDLAWRLDMEKALKIASKRVFHETGPYYAGTYTLDHTALAARGDIVLARRDIRTSYTLAVVVDDAYQNVTHVTRGVDLWPETMIQVLLQVLLDLPTPIYHHHMLIRDEAGKRLAKRDHARTLGHMRAEGRTPEDILDYFDNLQNA